MACEELAQRPLPSLKRQTPAWETIGNGSAPVVQGAFLTAHFPPSRSRHRKSRLEPENQGPISLSPRKRGCRVRARVSPAPNTPESVRSVTWALALSSVCKYPVKAATQMTHKASVHHSFIPQTRKASQGSGTVLVAGGGADLRWRVTHWVTKSCSFIHSFLT